MQEDTFDDTKRFLQIRYLFKYLKVVPFFLTNYLSVLEFAAFFEKMLNVRLTHVEAPNRNVTYLPQMRVARSGERFVVCDDFSISRIHFRNSLTLQNNLILTYHQDLEILISI